MKPFIKREVGPSNNNKISPSHSPHSHPATHLLHMRHQCRSQVYQNGCRVQDFANSLAIFQFIRNLCFLTRINGCTYVYTCPLLAPPMCSMHQPLPAMFGAPQGEKCDSDFRAPKDTGPQGQQNDGHHAARGQPCCWNFTLANENFMLVLLRQTSSLTHSSSPVSFGAITFAFTFQPYENFPSINCFRYVLKDKIFSTRSGHRGGRRKHHMQPLFEAFCDGGGVRASLVTLLKELSTSNHHVIILHNHMAAFMAPSGQSTQRNSDRTDRLAKPLPSRRGCGRFRASGTKTKAMPSFMD